MDFLGYAALGGLERVAIIAGALLIGFWGYRLYGKDKTPGLIFLGIASAVLIGALFTGGSHVQSVSEGIQLATVTRELDAVVAPVAARPADEEAVDAQATTAPVAETGATTPWADEQPATAADSAIAQTDAQVLTDAASAADVAPGESAALAASVSAVEAEASVEPLRLATGQELGGRIVSVKSANISLEWSDN